MSLSRLAVSLGLLALLSAPAIMPAQDAPGPKNPGVKVDLAGDPLPPGAVARLGTMRFRHPSNVSFVAYSGDGNMLITLTGDGTVRFLDAKNGREIRRLEIKIHPRRAMYGMGAPSVAVSGDGKTLAYGAEDGECTVVDIASGKKLKEFKTGVNMNQRFGGDRNSHTELSFDGKRLVTIESERFGPNGPSSKISVWDTTDGKLVRDLNPKNKSNALAGAAFSRDGKTVVCLETYDFDRKGEKKDDGKDDGPGKPAFRFINVADGKDIRSIPSSVSQPTEISLTADGKYLLTHPLPGRGGPGGISQIDAVTGKEVRQFNAKNGQIRGAFLAPDHKTLFLADFQQITQYDLKSGNVVKEFKAPAPIRDEDFGPGNRNQVLSAVVSPDGKTLAIPVQAAIAFHDVSSGKEIPLAEGHRNRVDSVAFSPGAAQVVTGSADGTLLLWNVAGSKRVREFQQKIQIDTKEKGRNFGPDRVDLFRVRGAFSKDGKTVAGLWWGEKLHIWDTASGELRYHLGDARGYTSFSHSPDSRFIALAGIDGSLSLWNLDTGRPAKTFVPTIKPAPVKEPDEFGPMFDQGAYTTAFSADGRMLISGGMHIEPRGLRVHVKYWEMASGLERAQLQTNMTFVEGGGVNFDAITTALDSFVVSLAFSPSGKIVAEAGFSNVKLRDVRTGAEIRSFGGKMIAANTALFSPDGTMLVAGKHDGAIRFWDVATGTVLADLPAHASHVTALTLSNDGKWLASGSKDASVLVWDWDYLRKKALSRLPVAMPAIQPDVLWITLGGRDAAKAYEAIKALAGAPAQSVPFLKARLRQIEPIDPKEMQRLLDDLGSEQFTRRQKAEKALEEMGDVAGLAIKERLKLGPPLEMQRRLEALQQKLDAQIVPNDVLQTLRGIETLELIGSAEARAILQNLAKGAPGHRVTEESRLALVRLR